MNFYKAKYLKNGEPFGRNYTFKSEETFSSGDNAETDNGKHVVVQEEPVDIGWVETYGQDKVVYLKHIDIVEGD